MPKVRRIDRSQIIVAIIGAIPLIIIGYWQFVWKPSPRAQQIEHLGRVVDAKTGATLSKAKVSHEFQGAPPTVVTVQGARSIRSRKHPVADP
jgi:hypothetical protein